jgi:DNA-binding GntR family transcriptional regulator
MNELTPALANGVVAGSRLPKAEMAYRALRDDIVRLALTPGAAIDKSALCRKLAISRFPVSDALTRLAREGLVVVEPQRGSYVAPIALDEVLGSLFVRRALEVEASHAAARAGPAFAAALRGMVEAQAALAETDDADGVHQSDVEFHGAIVDSLGIARASAAFAVACAHIERARRATLPQHGRLHEIVAEHRAIVSGIERADPAAASEAMRTHLDRLEAAIRTFAAEQPELFRS